METGRNCKWRRDRMTYLCDYNFRINTTMFISSKFDKQMDNAAKPETSVDNPKTHTLKYGTIRGLVLASNTVEFSSPFLPKSSTLQSVVLSLSDNTLS